MTSRSEIRMVLPDIPLRDPPALPYPLAHSGKVRDLFDLGDRYLILASDRVSAFDVVLPGGIPGKGILLTQLSLWWFNQTQEIADSHLVPNHETAVLDVLGEHKELAPRCMLVRKLKPLKIEAVVRGFLAGSAWAEYRRTGRLWDHPLPPGLCESAALPEPLFTPTTKADVGGKDRPMTHDETSNLLGRQRFGEVVKASLKLYNLGVKRAERAGLILADTKFEFGEDENGRLVLIDEVLTPDSSRYWPREGYEPGRPQPSFDKQYVRDYLNSLDWDKSAPGPELPPEIISATKTKYLQAINALLPR